MSKRGDRGKPDEEYVKAAWDNAKELETLHRVIVEYTLIPTNREGVWELMLLANSLDPGAEFMKPIARYRVQFPGPTSTYLGAVLLQAVLRLDALVAEYRAAQARPRA